MRATAGAVLDWLVALDFDTAGGACLDAQTVRQLQTDLGISYDYVTGAVDLLARNGFIALSGDRIGIWVRITLPGGDE